jgi:hypothetical protein
VPKLAVAVLFKVLLSGMELLVTLLVTVAPLVSTGTLTVTLVVAPGAKLTLTVCTTTPLTVMVAVKVAVALPLLVNVTVPLTVVPAGALPGRVTLVVKSGCRPLKVAVAVLLVSVVSGMLVVPTLAVTVLPPACTVSTGACVVVLCAGLKVIDWVATVGTPLTL